MYELNHFLNMVMHFIRVPTHHLELAYIGYCYDINPSGTFKLKQAVNQCTLLKVSERFRTQKLALGLKGVIAGTA